jgi:hypothetical protein
MAQGEGGYNPIEYHNGTVWPHVGKVSEVETRRRPLLARVLARKS